MSVEYTKVVPASCLHGSGFLLPPEFREKVVTEPGTHKFELQNAAGQRFPVTIVRKTTSGGTERADIHGGWRAFCHENGVEAGDEVRLAWSGGRVIEVTKTGNKGTPGRTPAKARASKSPRTARKSAPAAAKTPASSGGVKKSRGRRPSAAGAATPGSEPRRRRSSAGAAAAPAAEAVEAAEEPQQGGSWCAIM